MLCATAPVAFDPEVAFAGLLDQLGVPQGAARLRLHSPTAVADACCEPGVVHLRPALDGHRFWREGGLGRLMLAHEAVHVAQFELRGPPSPRRLLEREADEAAFRLLQGERVTIQHAAGATGRLHWNRAGHYYTIQLICLVAGASERDAQRMAFYGQLPDLVSEFDAITQAEIQAGLRDDFGSTLATGKLIWDNNAGQQPEDWEVCRDVIEGLHCLTGASVPVERQRRKAILSKSDWNSLRFGVALHAFGDAWAHCKNGVMYDHTVGHMWDKHKPDNINLHQDAYCDYAQQLFNVINGKIANSARPGSAPRPAIGDVMIELRSMAARYPTDEYEENQIAFLRGMIAGMSTEHALTSYMPAYDCLPWKEFFGKVQGWNLQLDYFDAILGFAREWRFTSRDSRTSAARIQEVRDRLDREMRASAAMP